MRKMRAKPEKGDRWTRDEMILVFNLYFKLSYGQMDHRNPKVQELAKIMGRSENSVAMRLNNFASCDPLLQSRGISGLSAHTKLCQPYWDEFFENQEELVFESEKILADYQDTSIEEKYRKDLFDIPEGIEGRTKVRDVKTRVNQQFFRQMVLANYEGRCALTGIDIPELLVASHIIPWSESKRERLNPENGLCLSSLIDKAFDKGLVTFSDTGAVMFSRQLEENMGKDYYEIYFEPIRNSQIRLPKRYAPNEKFLSWHRQMVFRG